MSILLKSLRELNNLFIINNNYYNNIYENILILNYNLNKHYTIANKNIAILSKNNKYYLDILLLALLKPLKLHNLSKVDNHEYYTNIILENKIDILIIDADFQYLIPDTIFNKIDIIIIGNDKDKDIKNKDIKDKDKNIKDLYIIDKSLNKDELIDKNVKDYDPRINIFYHTSNKSSSISIKLNILEYQIENISSIINSDNNKIINWFHNIPLYNPISLSYILAINYIKGNIFINTLDNDLIQLCNDYNISHMRLTQPMFNNNIDILTTLKNKTVIFCELKKKNILTNDVILNNITKLHIVYDIILLNMYGPILYSKNVNIYDDELSNKYIVHKLKPCKNIIMKHKNKNKNKNKNKENSDTLHFNIIKKFIYIKINIVYDKWIKINYNYIINNNTIYIVNNVNNINTDINNDIIAINKTSRRNYIYKLIIFIIRSIVIFIMHCFKCKIDNYVKNASFKDLYISPETDSIHCIKFNKYKLEELCISNNISLKYLLLSMYINILGNRVPGSIIKSYINIQNTMNYNELYINNNNNIPIYLLPMSYNIDKIIKYSQLLEKEYDDSYDVLNYLQNTFIYRLNKYYKSETTYGYNYINQILNDNEYYDNNLKYVEGYESENLIKNICNLNIFVSNDEINLIFNHKLKECDLTKISEDFKHTITNLIHI